MRSSHRLLAARGGLGSALEGAGAEGCKAVHRRERSPRTLLAERLLQLLHLRGELSALGIDALSLSDGVVELRAYRVLRSQTTVSPPAVNACWHATSLAR